MRTKYRMFWLLAVAIVFSQAACASEGGSSVRAPSVIPSEVVNVPVKDMKIRIKVGEKEAIGTLNDTPIARDFASLLPLTLELEDYAKKEKIGYLSRKLTGSGGDSGSGDIAYFAPWGNLAIFYNDIPSSGGGLLILGKIESNKEILNVPGSIKVTIELVKSEN